MKKLFLLCFVVLLFVSCLADPPEFIDARGPFFDNHGGVVWENIGWDNNGSEVAERFLTFGSSDDRILSLAYFNDCADAACLPSCEFIGLGYDRNAQITYAITEPSTDDTFVLDVAIDGSVSFQFVFTVGFASDTLEETLVRFWRNGIDENGNPIDLSNEPVTRYTRTNPNFEDPCASS